ncbi:MAG TPA: efflux RND transporter periplasmic adaptor subunit [Thermodesulfobacteriota bacterium]|nr:efflux RND transporter periplasmic adaptor subunit [Thermodesulfobacteriota bacterium]
MKTKWIFLILVLGILGVVALFLFKQSEKMKMKRLLVYGNIEATEVDMSFKIPGRVIHRSVDEGDFVKKGSEVATLEDEDLKRQAEEARASVRVAEARLREALAGSRSQEIKQAWATVEKARSDRDQLKSDWERAEALFKEGVIPVQSREQASTSYQMALAAYKEAMEHYDLVKEGPRKEDIDALKASLEQAKALLNLREVQLSYANLTSPVSGVVLVKNIEPGEMVSAGTPVVTIADLNHVWLKAYISETDLGRVKYNQKVKVKTDTYPDKIYWGRISFISSEAEFTPKNIQTHEERVKLVYRIKVTLENPQMELKPGMPADGEIIF